MATNSKKGKSGKDGEKKGSKRLDESPSNERLQVETPQDEVEDVIVPVETPVPQTPPRKEPTPEPVYEEPVLTQLIVTSYEGEKNRGLYDGEGEADFTGGHHYEGQFAEGLMHGIGTYTWNDGVSYTGDFCQNKITGKGTFTWVDGSTYDGDVVDGLRHGFGAFRVKENRMSYTGEWWYGKKHGKGHMDYDAEGLSFYEGDWVNNIRHGWGTRCYPSGNIYQGMWFSNIRHGNGTMRWLDRNQMYSGQWQDEIQHGMGQHIWFLRRKAGSQYPLRNMYDGEFVKGMRQGYGTFYYANGARYEGNWNGNTKTGKGKFVFKNGRVYEGVFEKDQIVEYPSFVMDGVTTPDLSRIRTRTPLATEEMSVHSNDSRNTYSPSFRLDVDDLLLEFPEADREEEAAQVIFVIMRHITSLRKVYSFYSGLGYEKSPDNTFVMNRMQFWRLMKDCRVHHQECTLVELDRVLGKNKAEADDVHNPYAKILFREFVNDLVCVACHLYHEGHDGNDSLLASCMSKLIADNILKHACNVQGFIYVEPRRSVNALVHLDQAYEIYKSFSTPRKQAPYDPSMKMRQFLFSIKDLKLVNADLTAKAIVDVLAMDDPNVSDGEGSINLELEMTFLEFFEALVGCAESFVTEAVARDPNTPRPLSHLTRVPSAISLPATASHMASGSLEGEEDGRETGADTPRRVGDLEEIHSPAPRSVSEMTAKTDRHHKHEKSATMIKSDVDVASSALPESARKPGDDLLLGNDKKSNSFYSTHSGTPDAGQRPLVQSVVSLGGARSEAAEDPHADADDVDLQPETDVEELDEMTRQFNFWTHQVHIFFVRKFFPASQRWLALQRLAADKLRAAMASEASAGWEEPVEGERKGEGEAVAGQQGEGVQLVGDSQGVTLGEGSSESVPLVTTTA